MSNTFGPDPVLRHDFSMLIDRSRQSSNGRAIPRPLTPPKVPAPAECSVPRTNVNAVIFDKRNVGQVVSPLSGRKTRLTFFDPGFAGRPRRHGCLNVEQSRIGI